MWHGMGDYCCSPFSMGRIKTLIEDNTPEGTYVHSLQIGDTNLDDVVNGFFMPVNDQVSLNQDLVHSSLYVRIQVRIYSSMYYISKL